MINRNDIIAHVNKFNRGVCGDLALYFKGADDLQRKMRAMEEASQRYPHDDEEEMHLFVKKQLIVITVAALMVSVSLLYCVEPNIGIASGSSLKTVPANASHAATND